MDGGEKKEKPKNLRENANPISAATFGYTLPTFFKGFKNDLEISDLPKPLLQHESAMLGDKIEAAWRKEEERVKGTTKRPSLYRVLSKVFLAEFMFYGLVFAFAEFAIRLLQPVFLGKVIRYFTPIESRAPTSLNPYGIGNSYIGDYNATNKLVQPIALGQLVAFYTTGQEDITKQDAYLYAAAVVACSLLNVFFTHPYMMGCLHLGMKMRVACCSLIYRKSLKLSKTALGQTTVGQLVNLLSNDVNRFDVSIIFAHNLWAGPLETIIITYLMYLQVGVSAVIGVAFLLIFIPLQIFLGKQTSKLRLRTAIRTDERIRLMNEIISGIQVIKMYTWEKPFASLVNLARRYEIKCIRGTSFIRGILLSFIMFTTRISIFVSVLAYVLFGNRITAEQVFVLTSFYGILRQNMTVFFPNGIGQIAEAYVSVRRLNDFMLYEENKLVENKEEIVTNGSTKETTVEKPVKGIFIKNATAKWTPNQTENTLDNITVDVRPGHLVAVIGPVGSGKSSLLHAILKELPLSSGTIDVSGLVSYASQEPWLFAGSVRQNILFGLPMDRMRYKMVVKKCALERDFTLLPYGDKTIVGERGVSLSGGQRARINLARAVYKQADVYLLDDPLSAVDTHVGKQLFEECVTGYLKEKTVILVTHQLQYLKEVDEILILKNGLIEARGNYNELRDTGLDFAKMLDKQPAEILDEPIKPLSRQSSIHSVASVTVDSEPQAVEETKSQGSIGGDVYKSYFASGGNCCFIFTVFLLFILAQVAGSGGDYFITYWVNLEQQRYDQNETQASNDTISSFWEFDRNTCIYIYSGVTIATVVLTLIRSFTFFSMCMRTSINLHDKMFRSITRATMYFFNTNPSGRILNRFSKDMGAIDELLPQALIDVLQIGLSLIGIIVVVAIVNYYLLLPTFIAAIIFYGLRKFYLATGRSVKRLEGVTRSPVFSHLNASLQGLTTIRAFKAQQILEKEFDNHQDLHSSAWYMFLATSRAFGFWLDLICVIYIAIVTLSFLVLGNEYLGGNVGLAITQSIGLTGMFQWGMRQSTELENQMTSVERVMEYTDLEPEKALETEEDKKPPPKWPSEGEVTFDKVYLRYAPNEPHVLRNLSFSIKPREKVGIVGRTGAGKSSLIAALFQLTETEGVISIDQVDSKTLGLHDLRSKISIIPQEPVLFSGTMRKNLDPFDEYSDEVLWKALEDVELKEAVLDLTSGLNSRMSEGGSNFSVGQRQLVCLARAIVRNNKILVLDEATANVDPHTDALIQTTIRKKFSNCTVLTIAHRLHTIMDSDKVLVMDAGTMVEFNHPHNLLQNKNGFLYGMVQQTGKAMAETLSIVAEQAYTKASNIGTIAEEE